MRRSLALRVFTICLLFLALPFIVYSFFITISEGKIEHLPPYHVLKHFIVFFCSFVFLGGGAAWALVRLMAKPLRHLDKVMQEVQQGNLQSRYIKEKWGFEINVLGAHFNEAMNALVKEKIAKEILEKELKIGREIQESLFPKVLPDFPGIDVATGVLFSKEVGGDFYDFLSSKGKLLLTIADVSGKGVGACLYSLGVRSLLRSSFSSQLTLEKTIDLTNRLFCEDTLDTGSFITAWIGSYNPTTRLLEYSSCGHPPALLLRGGIVIELSTLGLALGIDPHATLVTDTVSLLPGDIVLLYTDGVLEAHNPKGEMYGKERFLAAIKNGHNFPPQALIEHLLSEISTFSQDQSLYDDITLMIMACSP